MTKDLRKKIAEIVQKIEKERIDITSAVNDPSAKKKRRKEIARLLTEANKKTS